jgi:chaperonin GroES
MLKLETKIAFGPKTWSADNLTSRFSGEDLTRLGELVYEGWQQDEQSRAKWRRRNQAGMDLALQVQKRKDFPWPDCSNVAFPLVTIAALQFHARSYPTLIQGTDIVKMRVVGEDPDGEKKARADRVSGHMSWQVLEEDTAWEELHDRGLLNLSIVGTNFFKSYFDADRGHNVSELVLAKDLCIHYGAKSVQSAARITQILSLHRNEIYSGVKNGIYRDVLEEPWFMSPPEVVSDEHSTREENRKGVAPTPLEDEQTPFTCIEQHTCLDLDQDGYAEPYVITLEVSSRTVLRVVCAWDREEDVNYNSRGELVSIDKRQYFTKYGFIPSPDSSIYDIGFGILLGPLNESVNTAINIPFSSTQESGARRPAALWEGARRSRAGLCAPGRGSGQLSRAMLTTSGRR